MNFTKTEMELEFRAIKKEDRDLMAEIQDNMFVFENLGGSDRITSNAAEVSGQDVLVIAMKGAETALQDKLLACMSTRAAANIRDEMEALGRSGLQRFKRHKSRLSTLLASFQMMELLFLPAEVERKWYNGELQDNVLDDQNSDYTDLESLLAVANSSEFSVSDGYTKEKQEFEKLNSFSEIVASNEIKNLDNEDEVSAEESGSEISGLQIGSEADEEGELEISGLKIGSEADEEGGSEISGLQIGSEADEESDGFLQIGSDADEEAELELLAYSSEVKQMKIFRTHQRWKHH